MLASWTLYVLLGVLAGALTTVAGLGGGMLLIYALAALGDPHVALAATAPALLVGNLHRLARDVSQASSQVGASSAEISAASKQMLEGVKDQAVKVESSTAAGTVRWPVRWCWARWPARCWAARWPRRCPRGRWRS